MTAQFDRFIEALRQLCRKHKIQLAVSDYDGLQIWPLREGEEEIHSAGIEDMTTVPPQWWCPVHGGLIDRGKDCMAGCKEPSTE